MSREPDQCTRYSRVFEALDRIVKQQLTFYASLKKEILFPIYLGLCWHVEDLNNGNNEDLNIQKVEEFI